MDKIVSRRSRRAHSGGLVVNDDAVKVSDLVSIDSRISQQVKGLRKASGLSLAKLATLAGLSQGYLSQIERGLSIPSVKALHSISRALGVTISWFFQPQPPEDDVLQNHIVRAGRRRKLEYENGIVDYLLSPNLERQMELIHCTLPPGAGSGDHPYHHNGEEAGIVIAGQLDLWINDKHARLEVGDSFAFESSAPHRYVNSGDTPTVVIWAVTPPSY